MDTLYIPICGYIFLDSYVVKVSFQRLNSPCLVTEEITLTRMRFRFLATQLYFLLRLIAGQSLKQSINVVEFHENYTLSKDIVKTENSYKHSQSTRKLGLCLRVMARFKRPYYLIETDQLKISFQGVQNQLGFIDFPNQQIRMFRFCQPIVPGKWTALCFYIELEQYNLNITIVQNGQFCEEKSYSDGSIDSLTYDKSRPLKE